MRIFCISVNLSSPQACCLGLLAGGIALAKPSGTVVGLAACGIVLRTQSSISSVRLAVRWYCPHRVYALAAGQHDHRWLPIFPIVDWTFGYGPWTEIQSANWEAAHTGGGSLLALDQWLAYRSFGHWQWVTPWLVLVGLVMAPRVIESKMGSRWLRVTAFVLLTHGQSRFLVPMLPLFALIAADRCRDFLKA